MNSQHIAVFRCTWIFMYAYAYILYLYVILIINARDVREGLLESRRDLIDIFMCFKLRVLFTTI